MGIVEAGIVEVGIVEVGIVEVGIVEVGIMGKKNPAGRESPAGWTAITTPQSI